MSKLDKKVALITGGSRGIGFSLARYFVNEGAYVFITGRGQEDLNKAAQALGNNVTAIRADASVLDDIDKIYSVIKNQKGHLDILVANAGICTINPLESITEKVFDDTFNTNVKGVLFGVQKALPIFSDGGSIIMIGSVASIKGYEAMSPYCASKGALRSFARCWALELKDRKIRINVLSPGEIHTSLELSLFKTEEERKQFIETVVAKTPLGRRGEPDEIAKAAVFLASDDSSFITGIELFVDGGIAQI